MTPQELYGTSKNFARTETDGTLTIVTYETDSDGIITPREFFLGKGNKAFERIKNKPPHPIKKDKLDDYYAMCEFHIDGESVTKINQTKTTKYVEYTNPFCTFCGKQHLRMEEFDTQREANLWAEENCNCSQGYTARAERKQKKDREKNIKRIENEIEEIKEYFRLKQSDLTDDMTQYIRETAILIYDEIIRTAAFNYKYVSISLKKPKDGIVKFKLSYKDGTEREI